MLKFVIERQYLVPMYQHIVVEGENLEEACKKGISDDIDWNTQEMDCDSARATTITAAKVVPAEYEADQAPRCEPALPRCRTGSSGHRDLVGWRRPHRIF